MKVKEYITIYPDKEQHTLLKETCINRDTYKHLLKMFVFRNEYVNIDETEAIEILKQLPDNDRQLRPLIQQAGENVFGWK